MSVMDNNMHLRQQKHKTIPRLVLDEYAPNSHTNNELRSKLNPNHTAHRIECNHER
uniref:Uncharacterized protein n=1 Tax=Parascaris univalens TaxID=6257 RepID=A0A915AWA8_PARUN